MLKNREKFNRKFKTFPCLKLHIENVDYQQCNNIADNFTFSDDVT